MDLIRTKDGKIIDLEAKDVSSYEFVYDKEAREEYGEEYGFVCIYYYDKDKGKHIEHDACGGCSMDNFYLKDIVRHSEAIEDLCDAYICGDDYKEHIILSYEQMEESYWKVRLLDGDKKVIIYAAIWITGDNGEPILKSVAQMNERGELELL